MKTAIISVVCIAIIAAFYLSNKSSQSGISVITKSKNHKELNEQAFKNMRADTKWNLEGDMLWGFFFTNPTKPPLEAVSKQLEKKGYHTVDIYLDDSKENWWLHVEKIEIHTVDSLTQREAELSAIAKQSNLGSYDGWDVGPVGK